MQVVKYVFQPHGDDRGQLVALEEFKDIPFRIKRVYYMYDTGEGVTRGFHAHKSLQQILYVSMAVAKSNWIMGRRRRSSHWRSPTKVCMCPMRCGEKCLTSLRMRC